MTRKHVMTGGLLCAALLTASIGGLNAQQANDRLSQDTDAAEAAKAFLPAANEIIAAYGDGTSIQYSGYLEYVKFTKYAALISGRLGLEGTPTLENIAGKPIHFKEFKDNLLYCGMEDYPAFDVRTWNCSTGEDDEKIIDAWDDLRTKIGKPGPQDTFKGTPAEQRTKFWENLYAESDHWWRIRIDRMADTDWGEICTADCLRDGNAAALDIAKMMHARATSLAALDNADSRFREWQNLNDGDATIARAKLQEFYAREKFQRMDADSNGFVDSVELRNAYSSPSLKKQIGLITGPDFLLEYDEFRSVVILNQSKIPNSSGQSADVPTGRFDIARTFREDESTYRRNFESTASAKTVRGHFDREQDAYEAKVAAKAQEKVAGPGFVADRGWVFGERTYSDVKKKVIIDPNEFAVGFRIIDNFLEAGSTASSATIDISKDAGEDRVIGVDGALRLDFYGLSPGSLSDDGYFIKPAFGVDYLREGAGDDKTDRQHFFATADIFTKLDWPLLTASQFNIGPIYEHDKQTDVDRLTGLIEWEPLLEIGKFSTGKINSIGDGDILTFFARPVAAIELKDVVSKPSGTDAEDESAFRYGIKLGLNAWKYISFEYQYTMYHDLNDFSEDSGYQNAKVSIALDKDKRFSVDGEMTKGDTSTASNDIERYKLSLGVKF